MPAVSVAIFTHDHERYVAQCIESFLSQSLSGDEMEIIIVDDASTDATWEVIERYRNEPRVRRLIRHVQNLKAPRSYSDGMAAASGRYLVPVDGDDCALDRHALSRCLEILERHATVGFVHSGYRLIDGDSRWIGTRVARRGTGITPSPDAFERLLLGNDVHHSGTMIRRKDFDDAGGYDTTMLYSVDWELWLRIAARRDVAYIAQPLYAYRIHPGNLHLTRANILEVQMQELVGVIDRAVAYGPADRRHLRGRAHAAAYLLQATWRFSHSELGEGWSDLAQAFTADALLVRHSEFYRALLRLAAAAILRRRGYQRMREARDRIRRWFFARPTLTGRSLPTPRGTSGSSGADLT